MGGIPVYSSHWELGNSDFQVQTKHIIMLPSILIGIAECMSNTKYEDSIAIVVRCV